MKAVGGVTAAVGTLLVAVLLVVVLVVLQDDQDKQNSAQCSPSDPGQSVAIPTLPTLRVESPDGVLFSKKQLINAAQIMNAGAKLGLSTRDQTIGVMTAIGEARLLVLDRGDAVGPDSRGLFQQRANGTWGSYADRMDPFRSATSFFTVLKTNNGRDQQTPTAVAHGVQRNADPGYYTPFYAPAAAIVAGLQGKTTKDIETTTAAPANAAATACTKALPAGVTGGPLAERASTEGFSRPIAKGTPLGSPFGVRGGGTHSGQDFPAPSMSPIYAAADGAVIYAGGPKDGRTGNLIIIDHGNGLTTLYDHMWSNSIYVKTGDTVKRGQHIAGVGSSGNSSGPHLHFELWVDNVPVEPVAGMRTLGVAL